MALTIKAAALWAKTGAYSRAPGVGADAWHPLACHALDSAAAAAQLWDGFLAPATRAWLSSGLGARPGAVAGGAA